MQQYLTKGIYLSSPSDFTCWQPLNASQIDWEHTASPDKAVNLQTAPRIVCAASPKMPARLVRHTWLHLTIRRDACTEVAMSASLNWVFWKAPRGFPNCCREVTYSRAMSRHS